MDMKIPIGMVLKNIMDEKGLKAQEVADRLGLHRQSIYQSTARIEMSEGEIARWAKALGVTTDEITSRWKQSSTDQLAEQIARIEKLFKEQLVVKDQQIESLTQMINNNQKIIDALLGKSEGVPSKPGVPFLLLPGIDTSGYTRGYAKA